MKNTAVVADIRENKGSFPRRKFKPVLDILLAFTPILWLGILGTWIGTDTLLGGFIVNVGYIAGILAASFILKRSGTSWSENGLARPASWVKTIGLGFAVLILALFLNIVVQVTAINLPGAQIAAIDQSRFNPLEGNLGLLVLMVVLAWTTIAFGEEMFYRAFLLNRLGEIFQNTKAGTVFSVLVSSAVFGFIHLVEGPLGIVNTFVMGLLLAAVYLRTGKNLWVTIFAHGLANTLRFAAVYFGLG